MMICFTRKHDLWLWMLILSLYYAAAEEDDFISVDCGASKISTDTDTEIKWSTDASFISTGINHILPSVVPRSSVQDITNVPQLDTLRSFPANRSKHCYTLPASRNSSYLLRATFFHGGFQTEVDNKFAFSIDSTIVDRIGWRPELRNDVWILEYMVVATSNVINFCLIPDVGVAFISALELRPLAAGMYDVVFQGRYLTTLSRVNCGGLTELPIRYPKDPYDRVWYSPGDGSLTSPTPTAAEIIVSDGAPDKPPRAVMQSAWISDGFRWSFNISAYEFSFNPGFYTNHFFAEIENVGPTESRIVDIDLNGKAFLHDVSVNSVTTQKNTRDQTLTNENEFNFSPNPDSNLSALINAFEIYASRAVNQSLTDDRDVLALEAVKSSLGLSSWTGDPCLPVPYNWLTCNEETNFQVTKINLSQFNLVGTIPARIAELSALTELLLDGNNITGGIPDLSNLTELTTLHLQNNSLSGGIPSTLATLSRLTELFLSDNKLSGPIPTALAHRLNRGDLILTTSGNVNLCKATENCPVLPVDLPDGGDGAAAGLSAAVIGILVAGAVLLVTIGVLVWLYCRNRSKSIPVPASIREVYYDHEPDASIVREPNSSSIHSVGGAAAANQARAFSLAEVREATQSYKVKIGQGGFGPVYYGKLPGGIEMAVKVNSVTSSQGTTEFFNEVSLLSRVHHKNLVSLLGYCEENGQQTLIYEYMAKGTLSEHLYGKDRKGQISWKERLEIALNAAEGLDYLHNHCFPKIIHRDIKSNNILLSDKLLAKVADFGISKLAPEDNQSGGVSTKVIGTPGYLDPEYHKHYKLTQKSDLYSFGVVLLEIISGRPPISPEARECNLIQWAQRKVRTNDIESLVDPAIAGKYSVVAMWKVAELAMRCVESAGVDRPDMKQVVRGLTEALEYEQARTELQGYGTQAGMGVERGYGSTTFSGSSSSPSTRDYDQGSVKSVPQYPGLSPSASLLLLSDTTSFESLHSDIRGSGSSRLDPR